MIIELQESDAWKIQLTIAINFTSSKDVEKKRVMHSQSDNIKFTSDNDANKVADKLFDSSIWLYQVNLETSMGRTEFIFDSVKKMHYRCHKVNFICLNSFIDSPDWIKKKKKSTIKL